MFNKQNEIRTTKNTVSMPKTAYCRAMSRLTEDGMESEYIYNSKDDTVEWWTIYNGADYEETDENGQVKISEEILPWEDFLLKSLRYRKIILEPTLTTKEQ